jgi:hypothetical protein
LIRRRDDRRRDDRRHFASIFVFWLPSAHVRFFGILSRRRFPSVLSCAFTNLVYAIYGILSASHAWCRFVSIVFYGVSVLLLAYLELKLALRR